MSVKTTGEEWNKFYIDPEYWGDGQWHDDVVITCDGVVVEEYDNLPSSSKVIINGGYVVVSGDNPEENSPSMESYFKKWRKQQTTVFFSVECPKEKHNTVIEAIRAAGGKCKKN